MQGFVIKLGLICFSIFFAHVSLASESKPFPGDASYIFNLKNKYSAFPQELDKVFEHNSLLTLIGNGKSVSMNNLDVMDRLYISKGADSSDKKLILARARMDLKGSIQFNEVYSTGKGYIVHFKTQKSGVVAFFFRGFTLDKVQSMKDQIKIQLEKKSSAQAQASWNKLELFSSALLPQARAETQPGCGTSLTSTQPEEGESSNLQKLWECTKGFGGGIWDSTGGTVVLLGKGVYQIVRHPVDTFNEASAQYDQMKDMMGDLENTLGDLKAGFEALPSSVKVKIACEIVGSVGTAGLIAFFTAGSGSPALLRAISQAMLKVVDLMPKGTGTAETVMKMALKLKARADQTENAKLALQNVKDINQDLFKEIQQLSPEKRGLGALTITDASYASFRRGDFLKQFVDDDKFMAEIKRSDRGLYNEVMQAHAEDVRLQDLKEQKKLIAELLPQIEKSTTLSDGQKSLLKGYVIGSSCTVYASTKGQIEGDKNGARPGVQ